MKVPACWSMTWRYSLFIGQGEHPFIKIFLAYLCGENEVYPRGPAGKRGLLQGLSAPADPNARRGCAPSSALLPLWGRSAPPPPGDFPDAGKVTKGAPRAAPFGIPQCVAAALFALATHRAGLPSTTKQDRFATLGWWANRPLFLPKLYRGPTPCCQSVARQLGCVACGLPGVAPLSGGSGNAAGGMIMPPKGVQGACPLTRLCLLSS